jgi:hypothetical protein
MPWQRLKALSAARIRRRRRIGFPDPVSSESRRER